MIDRHKAWLAADAVAAGLSMVEGALRPAVPSMSAVVNARRINEAPHVNVVLTAPFGSMGDQALAAGSLRLTELRGRSGTVLVPGDTASWVDVGIGSVESLDDWHEGKLWRLSHHARRRLQSEDLFVVGADTIDGRYDHRPIALRVRALNECAARGNTAALVNFSVSRNPSRASLSLLKRLDTRVELWARDEASRDRAAQQLGRSVHLAPDVGLLMEPLRSERVIEFESTRAREPVAVIVPNAHLATEFGVSAERLRTFWTDLTVALSDDFEVVVMPHDTRAVPDDVGFSESISREAGERLGKEVFCFVPASSREAKGLVSTARVCVAARMHACVGALSVGTPTVGIDYLEKFVGQFAWYGNLGSVIPFESALDVERAMSTIRATLDRSSSGSEPAPEHVNAAPLRWL